MRLVAWTPRSWRLNDPIAIEPTCSPVAGRSEVLTCAGETWTWRAATTGKRGTERQRVLPPPVPQAILACAGEACLARRAHDAVFPR
jgi:hypothetical protein